MSKAARTAVVILTVALGVGIGVIVWMTMLMDQPEAAPIPGAGDARAVVADPSIGLPYLVEVPGTAAGCPGAAFRSPADPVGTPTDGNAGVMLPGADGAALIAACIGDVDDVGTPEQVVADLWSGKAAEESPEAAEWERLSVERSTSSYGDALALTSRLGTQVLTDHYVERDGWLYAVGYLRHEGSDVDRLVVDAILASWEWR